MIDFEYKSIELFEKLTLGSLGVSKRKPVAVEYHACHEVGATQATALPEPNQAHTTCWLT